MRVEHAIHEQAAALASKTAYTTSVATTGAGLFSLNDWMAIGGFTVGIATFAVNWVYKQKHFKVVRDYFQKEKGNG